DLSLEKPVVNDTPVTSNENLSVVVAPLMGTFYDSPSPDADSFQKVLLNFITKKEGMIQNGEVNRQETG
ncbi:hypothetical protein ACTPEM_22985, partial [Clostridioides difficile]